MENDAKPKIERKRTPTKWYEKDLKNLRFMAEFFKKTGYTLKDYERAGGTSAQSLGMLLSRDDMKLSKAESVLALLGFNLKVELEDKITPEEQAIKGDETYSVILPKMEKPKPTKKKNVRLAFLSEMMREKDITQRSLADRLEAPYGTVFAWFRLDDIFISYINKIKDAYDMKVRFIITPKEKAD